MPFNRIESPVQCAFSVSSQARPLIRQESTTTTDIRIFAIFNQGPGTLKVQVSSVSGEPHDVAPNETQNVLVRRFNGNVPSCERHGVRLVCNDRRDLKLGYLGFPEFPFQNGPRIWSDQSSGHCASLVRSWFMWRSARAATTVNHSYIRGLVTA